MNSADLYHKYVGRRAVLTVLSRPAYRRRVTDMDGAVEMVEFAAAPGVRINVHIRDVRVSYGRCHLLIEPESGSGATWIVASDDKLRVLEPDEDWPDADSSGPVPADAGADDQLIP